MTAATAPTTSLMLRIRGLIEGHVDKLLSATAVTGLAAGATAHAASAPQAAAILWSVATLPVLVALFVQIASSLRKG